MSVGCFTCEIVNSKLLSCTLPLNYISNANIFLSGAIFTTKHNEGNTDTVETQSYKNHTYISVEEGLSCYPVPSDMQL